MCNLGVRRTGIEKTPNRFYNDDEDQFEALVVTDMDGVPSVTSTTSGTLSN